MSKLYLVIRALVISELIVVLHYVSHTCMLIQGETLTNLYFFVLTNIQDTNILFRFVYKTCNFLHKKG